MRVAVALIAALYVASGFSRTSSGGVQTTSTDTTRPSFAEFLTDIRKEALSKGIRQEIVDSALNIDEPLPIVLERDRAQAETVLALETYLARRLTTKRIRTGREMLARHGKLLDEVAKKYDVPAKIIVAIWGVESEYGRLVGIRPTITALATLAWDPRRSAFFRGELFDALDVLNRGDIEFAQMKGSWAGAMGQPQFMPSSYKKYAEDFDDDGRKDIWTSLPDVFASIANYLKGRGWHEDETWGREVTATPEAARRIAAEVGRREGRSRTGRSWACGSRAANRCRRTTSTHRWCPARRGASSSTGTTTPCSNTTARTRTRSASRCWRSASPRARRSRLRRRRRLCGRKGRHRARRRRRARRG
jgi:lytic murein transglycosylase